MRLICSVCENTFTLRIYIYVNTCSIREGHFTCDAVAVNSKQSSVLNDLNYTVIDMIYHSVYTPPSFNICILKHKQHTCIYIVSTQLSVILLLWSQFIYIHTCALYVHIYISIILRLVTEC